MRRAFRSPLSTLERIHIKHYTMPTTRSVAVAAATATGKRAAAEEAAPQRRSKAKKTTAPAIPTPEHPCFFTAPPASHIRICTSGYSYAHWHQEGSFYAGVPASQEFAAYSAEFATVELNATFYRWFADAQFDRWRQRADAARPSFQFVVKACQHFTHRKRLHVDAAFAQSWRRFWAQCQRLGDHLGPVLFQFPENFKRTAGGRGGAGTSSGAGRTDNLDRLRALGQLLPRDGRFAFEFRDASWFQEDVYAVLREHNWCLVLVEVSGRGRAGGESSWCASLQRGPNPRPEAYPLTCTWVAYVRFHGADGQYCGAYGPARMAVWADRMLAWAATGRDVISAFNNTDSGLPPSAIADARSLAAALRRAV